MARPVTRSAGVRDLDDEALLRRFSSLGRLSKVAARRALALLPEIVRRSLHRRAGFVSPYEFAAKKVGVSRDVVDKVLRLYERIGHMPALWQLLAAGAEGWSKLEIVATVATPSTSEWWAERLPRWSRAEVSDYVRRLRAEEATMPAASPAPLSTRTSESAGDPSLPVVLERADPASDLEIPVRADADPSAQAGTQLGAEPAGLFGSSLPAQLLARPGGSLRPVTVYLEPEDEELLRALQEEIRRSRGEAVTLGDVIRVLLRPE
ncbi:MAG: hypothetical protein KGR26_07380, partial [Cyanobacteria bacterium REEB65]|nr:hypothetical protein [Cyanobacteria bacterium REEB65]